MKSFVPFISLFLGVTAPLCLSSPVLAQADGDRGGGNNSGIRGVINDFEPGNDAIGTAPIVDFNGRSTAVGILNLTPGESDFVRIPAAVNDTFAIHTIPLSSLPLNYVSVDTVLELRDPAGVLLVSDDDSGSTIPASTRASSVRFVATVAGNYQLRVRGFGAASQGRYALVVSKVSDNEYIEEAGDTPADPAVVGNSLAGALVGFSATGTGDLDYYAVDLNAGDVVLASTTATQGAPGSLNDPDLSMRLLGPDQNTQIVESLDDFGGNSPGGNNVSDNCFILFRASQTGRFYFEVTPPGTVSSGTSYRFLSFVLPGPYCAGDADGNGQITFNDITFLLANFGTTCQY